MDLPKSGEVGCVATYITGTKAGTTCKNKAYYEQDGRYLCGTHSKGGERRSLPKRTNAEKKEAQMIAITEHMQSLNLTAQITKSRGQQGQIKLFRMKMMKPVGIEEGYQNVFPNYKHGNRIDGYGCDTLSPMKLGPVDHGQPGLPRSENLENFHQGNKFYPGEDETEFAANRLTFYRDPVPHRRKFGSKDRPLYSIWIDKNGVEHQIDYITSRQFYCTFYERLARQQPAFSELVRMIKDGINIRICGFDAYPIESLDGIEKA
jgi:hypothetical protein